MLTSYGSEYQEYEVGSIPDVGNGLRYVLFVDGQPKNVVVAVRLVLPRGHRADLALVVVRLLLFLLGLGRALRGGAPLSSLFGVFFTRRGGTGGRTGGGVVIASAGGGGLAPYG